jgi:uncharacterized membrane protein
VILELIFFLLKKIQQQNKETFLGRNFYQDLNLINNYIKSGTRFIENYPDSTLLIYYEDLLLNTESEIMRVCDFLSLSFEKNMLHTNRKNDMSELAESNASHLNGFVSKELVAGKLSNENSDEWLTKLSKTDKVLADYYLSKLNFKYLKKYNIKSPTGFSFRFHWLLKNGLKRLFFKIVD